MRFSIVAAILVLVCTASATEIRSCPSVKIPARTVNGYVLKVIQLSEEKGLQRGAQCLAVVTSAAGNRTTISEDWMMTVDSATGTDLNGDGVPEVVVEGYSGGAHCCWTYWIVSLGPGVRRIAKLENDRPIQVKVQDGRTLIETLDGAFDYFDGLCHACTVFPAVTIEIRGNQLRDVSAQFRSRYDREIEAGRRAFKQHEGAAFRNLGELPAESSVKYEDAKRDALIVVLAYLYSGREGQAWTALHDMWPAGDQQRIKELILKTRSEGILTQLSSARSKGGKKSRGGQTLGPGKKT